MSGLLTNFSVAGRNLNEPLTVADGWNIYNDLRGISQTGTGDVVGTPPSTDNAIARYDGVTGVLIQNSLATISDTGTINIPAGENFTINGVAIGNQSLAQTLAIGASANQVPITSLFSLTGHDSVNFTITDDNGGGVTINPSGALSISSATSITIDSGGAFDLKVGGVTTVQIGGAGILVDSITELTAVAGVTIHGSGIKTDQGTLTSPGVWKLGRNQVAACIFDGTQYIEVEIGGSLVKLARAV